MSGARVGAVGVVVLLGLAPGTPGLLRLEAQAPRSVCTDAAGGLGASPGTRLTVYAAVRGHPWLNLQDGVASTPTYVAAGPAHLVRTNGKDHRGALQSTRAA